MRSVQAGALYFVLVFGAGCVLGPIRILWLVPRVGVRTAELIEMPIMLTVCFFAARWTVRRLDMALVPLPRLVAGLIALGLLLCAEWSLALMLRADRGARDPVSGTAYVITLGLFAILPLLVRVESVSHSPLAL